MKKSRSKLSKNELVCMCKDGCCVGLRLEEGCLSKGGENCIKYLTKVWNRKDGRENKFFFKKKGKTGSRGVCLKKGVLHSIMKYGLSLLNLCPTCPYSLSFLVLFVPLWFGDNGKSNL